MVNYVEETGPPWTCFEIAPSLKAVQFEALDITRLHLPWSQIEDYKWHERDGLVNPENVHTVQVVSSCPNLATAIICCDHPASYSVPHKMTLQYLHQLELAIIGGGSLAGLLNNVTLPALTWLRLGNDAGGNWNPLDYACLRPLQARSQFSLEFLDLHCIDSAAGDNGLFEFFEVSPSIKTLQLR
ncbi:hypothetical protein C8J56DRAFT_254851 [Mycena floridula]|nr:hypothetical protein C8J56DRAFT_254851 [Mycena floridula]